MHKLLSIFAVLAVCAVSIMSCSKPNTEDDSAYFSDAEKAALKVLHGSFAYTLSVGDWSNTTTITFLEQYNPPKKGTLDDGTEIRVHGKYRVVYNGGETFEKYFNLSNNADRIYSYWDLTSIKSIEKKDFRIVDDNSFQLKEVKDVLWDTYKRK